MAQILNFEKMEVMGTTKDEALSKAPFGIMGDATQAYKNWLKKQVNGVIEADKTQFMLDYLTKKSKNCPGAGFYITLESAVADTRERPYTKYDVKNEQGTRKWTTVFQIYENLGTKDHPKRGELLVEAAGNTKSDASNKAKELYTKLSLRKNVVCYYTKQVTEGEPIAFTMEYTPSKSARVGRYLVFGIK